MNGAQTLLLESNKMGPPPASQYDTLVWAAVIAVVIMLSFTFGWALMGHKIRKGTLYR